LPRMDPYPFDVVRDAMRSTGPAGHVTSLSVRGGGGPVSLAVR
jgi:hypothetical protein